MSNIVRGSLRVECEGDCERLLNGCIKEGIGLWDIKRSDDMKMTFCCKVESIYKLRSICRRGMCRLHVIEKRGMPFFARAMLRRPALIVGLSLCLCALWLMSRCVWSIEISAPEKIDKYELQSLLREGGLRLGVPVRSVRAQKIRNSVISGSDDVAYLTVNIKGSRAYVEVFERTKTERLDSLTPCDVYSELTGVITAIRVRQGLCELRVGQVIKEGDIIAAGTIVGKEGVISECHGDAEVDVRTFYNRKCLVARELYEYVPTGKTKTRSYLIVGQKTVKLYMIESIGYKWYYKSVKRKDLHLGDALLPVTLVTETYTECDRQQIELGLPELEQLLKDRMTASFLRTKPQAAIVKQEFYINRSDSTDQGVLRLECDESTGIKIAR